MLQVRALRASFQRRLLLDATHKIPLSVSRHLGAQCFVESCVVEEDILDAALRCRLGIISFAPAHPKLIEWALAFWDQVGLPQTV